MVHDTPALSFVEQPRPEPRSAEGLHALQVDPSGGEGVESPSGVVVALAGHDTDAHAPQARSERGVEDRPSRRAHARAAVGEHDVVDEEVPEDDEVYVQL